MYLNKKDPEVMKRQAIEVRIVKATVNTLLKAGFELAVFDGGEQHPRTMDTSVLYKQLMETDEDHLMVYWPGKKERFGWVRFVYGNDGWDVISDYTTNLEVPLKAVNALAQKLGGEA